MAELIKKIKKIQVNKNEEAASVAEKIIDVDAEEIILNVPKFSKLSESSSNFHLIKREAEILNKKIIIESVDDKVIEFCRINDLESLNPLFLKTKKRFSDIQHAKSAPPAFSLRRSESVHPNIKHPNLPPQQIEEFKEDDIKPRGLFKKIITIAILIILIAAGVKIVQVLPQVEIKIISQKVDWNYKDSIIVDKAISDSDWGNLKIPGQVFIQKNNLSSFYKATGKKMVEKKASGKITVFNSYSSASQPLLIETRFAAPDGKIFKSTKVITVPGAKIVGGKIVPSSIEVNVVAEKAGEAYNIGPTKFTLIGFKGSPKYTGFFGESKDSMKGGFVGEVIFSTDDNIKKAKEEIAENLKNSINALILAQIPKDFKAIDGATEFKILNQKVSTEVDASGNFSVFAEAEMALFTFRENDLLEVIKSKMKNQLGGDFEFKEYAFNYGMPLLDVKGGKMNFPVDFKAIVSRIIDIELLKEKILGQSEQDLKALLFALPGLENAKVSLWPFWVKSIPKNKQRITIVVE
jgi:hypothetical protein